MGPVGAISMLEYDAGGARFQSDGYRNIMNDVNDDIFVAPAFDAASFHWLFIPIVKQKPIEYSLNGTQKLLMYIWRWHGQSVACRTSTS